MHACVCLGEIKRESKSMKTGGERKKGMEEEQRSDGDREAPHCLGLAMDSLV